MFEALDDGTLIAFGYEIKDWKNKLFWHAVYGYASILCGALFIVGLIYYDQKKEEAAKQAEGKGTDGMQKVQQTDDLEMTTDVSVTHF